MRKISKIRLILCSVLACFAVGCVAMAAGVNIKANASGTFEMKSGASVKVGTDNGLRFTAVLPASEYEVGATYGMLIAPEDYVRTNDLTVENVFGENAVYDYAVKDEQGNWVYSGTKTRIINVTYDTLSTDENGDYLIKGSILSLKDNNIARNFAGRAYKRTGTAGSYVYEMANYANGEVGNNTRSMFTVAKAAINSDKESVTTKAVLESEYIDKLYTLATLTEGDDYAKFISKQAEGSTSTVGDFTEISDIPSGYDKAYKAYAGYAPKYNLFGNLNADEYIRLKFMIKGTYDIPFVGFKVAGENEESSVWKEVKFVKRADGSWRGYYDGNALGYYIPDDTFRMGLSGEFYITDLYGVKEDTSAKYYRVTFKDKNGEILGYKSIKSGNAAEWTFADEDLGDEYVLTYENVKWLDSANGNEVDLSSVTEDKTVYFGGESIIYKNVSATTDTAITALSKYVHADKNGIIKFKAKVCAGWSGFNIIADGGYLGISGGVSTDDGWFTVTINTVSGEIVVYDKNGNVRDLDTKNYTPTATTLANIKLSVSGGAFDLATTYEKTYTVVYKDKDGNAIGTEEVIDGDGAAFVPTATMTEDGYTVEYGKVVWLDSVGGDEVDLSSVTKNMTVYFGGESIIYKNVSATTDTAITALNKYVHADKNGIIKFKAKVYAGWSGFNIIADGGYLGISGGVSTSDDWFTVTINTASGEIVVYDKNGSVRNLDTGNYTPAATTLANIKLSVSGGTFDLAAIQEKTHTIVYKDDDGNVIGTEEVADGGNAAFVPAATTTEDGYTVEYSEVVWLDSVDGDEIDLSSVTKNMTVYFGGETITYKNVSTSGDTAITTLNKYVSVDDDGIVKFKFRVYAGWTGFNAIIKENNYIKISGGVVADDGWFTVTINTASGEIVVYDKNGNSKGLDTGDYTPVATTLADIKLSVSSGTFDLAAVSSKKNFKITGIAVSSEYDPSATSRNEDDRVYKYAVEELAELYSELTGDALEVSYVGSLSELDTDKRYFVLGSALAEEKGFSLNGLTTDTGYIVKKKSGNVYLYGKTGYGVLNALYEAFSQAFGLEFYTDTVYTYDSGEFDYDKIEDTLFNPSIDYNWASGEMEYIPEGESQPNWKYQHRLGYVNSWQIRGGDFHNFLTVLPKETYGAAHPNWYTTATNLGGASFDTLSLAYGLEAADNDAMATTVADYVYDYITEQAANYVEKQTFVFGQPDSWGWSNSSYSQAIKNKYGAYSAEYILFMNKVAKILDDKYTFGRRLELTLLVYNATLEAPSYSDDLKFYNGDEIYMGIIYAPIESNLYLSLDSTVSGFSEHNEVGDSYASVYGRTNQYYYNQLLEWKKFLNGGELSVFYYSTHYDNYFVPLDSVTNMGEKYKFFAYNGVKHIYNLGQANDDVHTDWYALKTYMGNKYAENAARTDADELILNFCKAYYGAAGEIMYELYKAEVAQYKVASDYWIKQKGGDPTGGHLIRNYLFNKNCWGGNANLLLGWYGKIENALAAVESGSEYYNRVKVEGLNIRYLLAGVFKNTTKGTMSDIAADAKSLGIDRFAEGNAYTTDGQYDNSGKIEDLN